MHFFPYEFQASGEKLSWPLLFLMLQDEYYDGGGREREAGLRHRDRGPRVLDQTPPTKLQPGRHFLQE